MQSPITVIKAKKENKEIEKETKEKIEELNNIWDNINNYDGTSQGQKELRNIETGL